MNAAELLADLGRHGIRLQADGEWLRYAPRSAVTPELAERMKEHKPELLSLLRTDFDATSIDPSNAGAVSRAALNEPEQAAVLPESLVEALRTPDVRWASDELRCEPTANSVAETLDKDGWPAGCIDPDELAPCPKCGTLELWESVTDDRRGLTPGRWRCMMCDPPTVALRALDRVERIRRRAKLLRRY